jgi:TonB family protein
MMRGRTIPIWVGMAIMAGSILPQIASAAAEPKPPLAPSSKWQVDYAPTECRLMRNFGEGKDQILLQISRYDLRDRLEMGLAGRSFPMTDDRQSVSVSTTTVAEVPGMHAQGFASMSGGLATLRFQPDVDLPKALRSDVDAGQPTILGIRFVGRYAARFDLGSMKSPLAALDKCADNLIASWGLDPAQQRQLENMPEPVENPANWFRPEDYPSGLNHMGMGGAVIIRLLVGADGTVQKCEVTKSGGDKAFQDATCAAATKRAKFRPAVAADGQPVASVWINRINWKPGAPFFVFR